MNSKKHPSDKNKKPTGDLSEYARNFAALIMGYSSYEETENIKNNGTTEEKTILYMRAKFARTASSMEEVLANLGFGQILSYEIRNKIMEAFNDMDEISKLIHAEDAVGILIENLVELKPDVEWKVLAFCENTINCVKNIMLEIALLDAERAVLH